MTRWKRNLIKVSILLLVAVGLAVVSLPIWWPWALFLAARPLGLEYGSYQRQGWNRFVIKQMRYEQNTVLVEAERVESALPYVWLSPFGGNRFVKVEGWKVTVTPGQKESKREGAIQSVWDLVLQLGQWESQLWTWLPKAELRRGEVELKGRMIALPEVHWSNRVLRASISTKPMPEAVRLRAGKSAAGRWEIQAGAMGADSQWWMRQTDTSVQGEGKLAWQGNTALATFHFARQGWLPAAARLQSGRLEWPVPWLSQQGYRPVTGEFLGVWDGKELKANLEAQAQPKPNQRDLIPFTVQVAGGASQKELRLDTLSLRSEGVDFRLIDQARLSYEPPFLENAATFLFKADMQRLPWEKLTGAVGGHLELNPNPGRERYPLISLQVGGRTGYEGVIQFQEVDLSARLDWPWIELRNATMVTTNHSRGTFSARYNLVQGRVENGRFAWQGIPEAGWIPEKFGLGDVEVRALVEGPWQNPAHQGSLRIEGIRIKEYSPVDIETEWQGASSLLSGLKARIEWGDSQVLWEGRGGWLVDHLIWTNSVLDLQQAGETVLGLEHPSVVEWAPAKDNSAWRLEVSAMEWSGSGGEARLSSRLAWPQKGAFDLSLLNLRLKEFQPELPPIQFDMIRANGHWDQSPLAFQVELNGSYQPRSKKPPFRLLVAAVGDAQGVRIRQMEVLQAEERAVSAEAVLPVHLGPGYKKWMEVDEAGEVRVRAQSYPQAELWRQLEELTQLVIRNPAINLEITGTKRLPQVDLEVQIQEVRPAKPNPKLPALREFETEVHYDGQLLELERLQGLVEGQLVQASAEMPFYLDEPWRQQLVKARGRFQIPKMDLTPILQPWTNLLIPRGQLQADIMLEPGLKWGGKFEAQGLESQPLATMGTLQDIHLLGIIEGRKVSISEGGANIGGDPVRLWGELNFAKMDAGLPLFDVRVQSAEVPLARQPDLILRSGFDLAIQNERNKPVTISGQVKLTNSVYLSDLELLIPGKVASPERRPPYFSITNQPVADWNLEVEIQGDRFIRIRSPIFRGLAGIQAQLRGTLREPILLGQVSIPSGFIQFPFGNLEVRQGVVSLTSENPFQPQIDLRAASRVFGYEVQMTVRGSIQEPIIEFSAIPGLSSEQVVLMLTAGELPQQNMQFTGRQKATHLGLFVGKSLMSQFSEDANVSDRLTVQSGQDITSEGRQTYLVEYQWSDNWSLVAEYDRFGDYSGGVKWRFYSR